ncbi:MAG TPA: hypothetical protein PLB32_10640, partial [Acidobacteriota bacterium]|nr:hypothetical protein [Acidobacteriota bacterium]
MNLTCPKILSRIVLGLSLTLAFSSQLILAGTVGTCIPPSGLNCVPGGGDRGAASRLALVRLSMKTPRTSHSRSHLATAGHRQAGRSLAGSSLAESESSLRRDGSRGFSWMVLAAGFSFLLLSVRPSSKRRAWKKRAFFLLVLVMCMSTPVPFVTGIPLVAGASSLDEIGFSPLQNSANEVTSGLEIGGLGQSQIGGTTTDAAGNLYVTGGFTGSLVFDTVEKTVLTARNGFDFFIAKYSPTRKCLWAREATGSEGLAGGFSLDGGLAIAVDGQGNSFVGGSFVSQLVFKNGQKQPVATLTAGSTAGINFEAFVAKYDRDGNLVWAKGGLSGSRQSSDSLTVGINSVTGVVLDRAGTPYVCGQISGQSFLGTSVAQAQESDTFVSRLNPATGEPVWISISGGEPGTISTTAIAIDAAANTYVLGTFDGSATFPTTTPTTL